LMAGEGDFWAYAWRLAYLYRFNQNPLEGIPTGSLLQGGLAIGLKTSDSKLLIGPEVYGATGVGNGQSLFNYATTPVEAVLGIHYRIGQFVLGLAGGPGLSQAFGTPTFRGLFSFDWAPLPPPSDRDNDGIPDNVDACPDTPGVASDDPKFNGCPAPPPPSDRDHDGIPDDVDACPDTPGVASDDPKKNGCPPPPPDRDHDGIPDDVDACPDTPGVANDDPKKNGCPLPPPDRDHDGIPDAVDACPDTPGIANDDPKKNGCPKDTDNDGVPDSEDNCPTVPGPASNHGCPVKQKQLVVLKIDKIEILQKVFFKTGKATIQKRSFALLNQVAAVLKSHPDIAHVQVEGHTDNVGKPAKNQLLSQARADSVKLYLADQGVEEDRLIAKGFGQDRPIQPNTTATGRAANRRVEFNIPPAAAAEPQVVPLSP
jgi:OOP family OmpA-OmpF porin